MDRKEIGKRIEILSEAEDIPYEEDVLRNPYSIRGWWRYLNFKKDAPRKIRNQLYERAIHELPGSYKLWSYYLRERRMQIQDQCPPDGISYKALSHCFERALVTMHKMPRIWLEYLEHLCETPYLTQIRHTFDRALKSLPITQHQRIWKPYTAWVQSIGIPETAVRVWRRYLKLDPLQAEEYVDYLLDAGYFNEAATQMVALVNNHNFESLKGKSRHELWLQLCKLCAEHPSEINSIRADVVIRAGIRKFVDQVASLWTSLAAYYTRLGQFDKARDIFEEALQKVSTVRDFCSVWDAYTHFCETILSADMESQESGEDLTSEDEIDFEMRMESFEALLDRRPLLLNAVLLRQNPHNVAEWHNRVQVYEKRDDFRRVVDTYKEALKTVDAEKVPGVRFSRWSRQVKAGPQTLWIGFARFYDKHRMLKAARKVYERATLAKYASLPQLAVVWVDYVECELKHGNYRRALSLLQRALEVPIQHQKLGRHTSVQERLFKSTRLWRLLVDLEESLGSFDSTCAAYERMLDLKLATPLTVINYAHYLAENKYYEDSFRAYERGVALFDWPYVGEIWRFYLTQFSARYGGSKIERSRDLFEQCLDGAPPDQCKLIYLMYAELEEEHGLARHALAIYDRACRAVAREDQPQMYQIYIGRATELFGVTRTREIFERAIASLYHEQVPDMCLQYADLESKLGEIDRARAIFVHGSQYCDPGIRGDFWTRWRQFEVQHGNEETFAEMLRIRRSVRAQYSTQTNLLKAARRNDGGGKDSVIDSGYKRKRLHGGKAGKEDQMKLLEEQQNREKKETPVVADVEHNTEEMQIDMSDDDDDDDSLRKNTRSSSVSDHGVSPASLDVDLVSSTDIEKRQVPAAVFGALAEQAATLRNEPEEEPMGALERMQKRAKLMADSKSS